MISIELITDDNELLEITNHPDLAKAFHNMTIENIPSIKRNGFYHYKIIQEQNIIGCIAFRDFTDKVVEFHGGIHKSARGSRTADMLAQAFHCLAGNQDCVFITYIPEDNIPAIKLVEKCGLQYKATIPGGMKDGRSILLYSEV